MSAFARALRAEWTKNNTTLGMYLLTGAFLVITLLAAIIPTQTAHEWDNAESLLPMVVGLIAFPGLLLPLLWATLTVTADFKSNGHLATFLATPRRELVVAAKWLIGAVGSALLMLAAVLLATGLLKLLGPDGPGVLDAGAGPGGFDPSGGEYIWRLPLSMLLAATIAQGLGWLTRSTAGSLAIMLLSGLPFLLLQTIRPLRDILGTLNPVSAFHAVQNGGGEFLDVEPGTALVVLLGWTALAALVGLLAARRRDV